MKLEDKVTNARNETRVLIVATQILLSLQLSATSQTGFPRLPGHAHSAFLASRSAHPLLVHARRQRPACPAPRVEQK